jgi:hypothetical protein
MCPLRRVSPCCLRLWFVTHTSDAIAAPFQERKREHSIFSRSRMDVVFAHLLLRALLLPRWGGERERDEARPLVTFGYHYPSFCGIFERRSRVGAGRGHASSLLRYSFSSWWPGTLKQRKQGKTNNKKNKKQKQQRQSRHPSRGRCQP